jgi:hypothetical protein
LYQQYGRFVGGLARGELGQSLLTERSVNLDIRTTFPATLELDHDGHHRVSVRRAPGRGGGAVEGPLA